MAFAAVPHPAPGSIPPAPETAPIPAPPERVTPPGWGNVMAMVVPMVGSMGVMAFLAFSGGNPRMMLMGGGMVVAMLAMAGINVYRTFSQHRNQVDSLRRDYLAQLSKVREQLRTAARQQRDEAAWRLPDPRALVLIADQGDRVWERPASPSALETRIGSSAQPLTLAVAAPTLLPQIQPDAVCLSAVNRLVATHAEVDNAPVSQNLGALSHLEITGDLSAARDQVRAMVTMLATFVAPSALRIAVLCSEELRPEWDWIKWLPHARSADINDSLGPARMVASDPAELTSLLGADLLQRPAFSPRNSGAAWPQFLVIVDDALWPRTHRLGSRQGIAGVTVATICSSFGPLTSLTTLRLTLSTARAGHRPTMHALMLDVEPATITADAMPAAQAEAVARRLTPWSDQERPTSAPAAATDGDAGSADLMQLLQLGDIRDFDPAQQWTQRQGQQLLRVPFGITPDGAPVVLDLKESAHAGMGPHGLLVGATGSGKSEVLRTLTMALTLTHAPDQLNLVLVDFKGGATFAGLTDLPHVSAMISNLESELSLVDRMQDALRGEMVRRQRTLREAGNYANVSEYEADRRRGKHSYPALPALVIILDEFSELLSAKPEFIDIFVAIGRLGRSLAIHLLLSSQRLEEGRLRGLDSHLSYRIGLRTFSASESRQVLGVPDAYELPPTPGAGFLRSGSRELSRFQASYVAAPLQARAPSRRPARPAAEARPSAPAQLLRFTSTAQWDEQPGSEPDVPEAIEPAETVPADPHSAQDARWEDMSQLNVAVARMTGHGTPAHKIWLPPLDKPDTLDGLYPEVDVDPALGLVSHPGRSAGRLRVPMGTIDVPLEQRRETLVLDLAGAGGNVGLVGGPLSGKSTAARTLILGLCLTNTPQEVQFYILDFGGGTFAAFTEAPHVAGVASRDQADEVRRVVAELESLIEDRERYFRTHQIDSMQTYREGRASGKYDDGYGDLFLVVDGWSTIRAAFDDLEPRLQQLATRSLSYGVHFLITASRWSDIRQQVKDLLGSRIELRLGDPGDSEFDRRVAGLVPKGRPGRGLEPQGCHVLLALPRIDGQPDPGTVGGGVADLISQLSAAWRGPAGPKLRLLPTSVALTELQDRHPEDQRILLGIEETRLAPLTFDRRTDAHLYVLGDARSGKSTFLRALIRDIMRTGSPEEAQLFLVDLRRSLLGEVPDDYLNMYSTTRDAATTTLTDLAAYLQTRLPGSEVTAEQLRNRSWWSGPDVWVLIDDYDLVATASGNPAAALQPLLAQALDIGLHVIIARRSGGAARAMFEPVLQTMTELGTTGLLLSGNPDDGAIIGRTKLRRTPPGRAQVISRDHGITMTQLAWAEPQDLSPEKD